MNIETALKRYRENLCKIYDATEAKVIANIVFEEVLHLNPLQLELNKSKLLTEQQQKILNEYMQRLAENEPVQYVLGKAIFMNMELKVNSATLIPRPETEELVYWIKDKCGKDFDGKILDIGTGSGCIAIGLKKSLPKASIFACDVSSETLHTAEQNANRLNTKISFFTCNILEDFSAQVKFDLIVSNPPYIAETEKTQIEKNVLDFEPHLALFAPSNDALIFYKKIIEKSTSGLLQNNGSLFFEIHYDKAGQIKNLLANAGFKNIEIKKDFFGKNRMVKAEFSIQY